MTPVVDDPSGRGVSNEIRGAPDAPTDTADTAGTAGTEVGDHPGVPARTRSDGGPP